MSIFPFDYEGQQVNAVTIDDDGWLVGTDVARALGYANPSDALSRVHPDDKRTATLALSEGSRTVTRERTLLNESGVYFLVLGSTLDSARAFQRWVTSEVLPSIRKRGGYLTPEATEAALTDPDFIIRLATELKAERARVAELTPKAEAFDGFISTVGDLSLNEAAKEIARTGVLTGEKRLRNALMVWGWMYRDATGKPRAYQAQIDNGRLAEKAQWHFHPETGEKVLDTPQVRMTAKGMEAARQRLTKEPAA